MIRWAYAINAFKPQFDDFARRREHERALRVISISGFEAVELQAGSGRWEPLGNPTQVAANFGSVGGFGEFVRGAALSGVSSWTWDPGMRFHEDLTFGDNPADEGAVDGVLAHARWFADALAELNDGVGAAPVLVARPAAGSGRGPDPDASAIERIAQTWNAVGAALASTGVRLALKLDCLSSLRADHGFEQLIAATDPAAAGFCLNTADLTISGVDPVDFYRRHHSRIVHVQLENCSAVDDLDEYRDGAAEFTLLRAGGRRAIPRWFLDLRDEGLVDSTAMVRALVEHDYDGWVVVESLLTPHPATSVMLNGYRVQRELMPLGGQR